MKKKSTYCLLLLSWGLLPGAEATRQRIEEVKFVASCDGSEQRYVILYPRSFKPNATHDLMIALHGAGSDRWQFVKDPRDECRAARDVAADHHMLYVAPDYRASTSWMGPMAETDLLDIIAELRSQYRVGRIFLCGGSMGATAALTFAALHPQLIDGVAAMNGTANLLEYKHYQLDIRNSFGGTKAEIPEEYKKRSAEYWPERLTMRMGMTVSGKDSIVPPDSVRRLAGILQSLGRETKLIDRPERGHDTGYDDAKAILDFVVQRRPIPDGLVVLTLDDRSRSWATNVAPILKGYGFGATFYVTEAEWLGYYGNEEFWITWEEIRALHEAGFEIGNHGQTHANFQSLSKQAMLPELQVIEESCKKHGVPRPITFSYPAALHDLKSVEVLGDLGYAFARRGVSPEYTDRWGNSRGPIYNPELEHPLLVPGAFVWASKFGTGSTSDREIYRNGGTELGSTIEDFTDTVRMAKNGRIVVLVFHGVPDYYAHCTTTLEQFKECMQVLHDQGCKVIAMRDLLDYVDPNRLPSHPYEIIEQRMTRPLEEERRQ